MPPVDSTLCSTHHRAWQSTCLVSSWNLWACHNLSHFNSYSDVMFSCTFSKLNDPWVCSMLVMAHLGMVHFHFDLCVTCTVDHFNRVGLCLAQQDCYRLTHWFEVLSYSLIILRRQKLLWWHTTCLLAPVPQCTPNTAFQTLQAISWMFAFLQKRSCRKNLKARGSEGYLAFLKDMKPAFDHLSLFL